MTDEPMLSNSLDSKSNAPSLSSDFVMKRYLEWLIKHIKDEYTYILDTLHERTHETDPLIKDHIINYSRNASPSGWYIRDYDELLMALYVMSKNFDWYDEYKIVGAILTLEKIYKIKLPAFEEYKDGLVQ